MRKVVILEGPDGSGKTTLAKRLSAEHAYIIAKTGPPSPTEDVGVAYMMRLVAAITAPHRTVFDRLHLGEAIYGPLLRGVDRMGRHALNVIERTITENDVRLIIVCPPWEALVAGWRSKDDLLKSEGGLRAVRDKYLAHASRLGLQVYDWTAPNSEETLKEMIGA